MNLGVNNIRFGYRSYYLKQFLIITRYLAIFAFAESAKIGIKE